MSPKCNGGCWEAVVIPRSIFNYTRATLGRTPGAMQWKMAPSLVVWSLVSLSTLEVLARTICSAIIVGSSTWSATLCAPVGWGRRLAMLDLTRSQFSCLDLSDFCGCSPPSPYPLETLLGGSKSDNWTKQKGKEEKTTTTTTTTIAEYLNPSKGIEKWSSGGIKGLLFACNTLRYNEGIEKEEDLCFKK